MNARLNMALRPIWISVSYLGRGTTTVARIVTFEMTEANHPQFGCILRVAGVIYIKLSPSFRNGTQTDSRAQSQAAGHELRGTAEGLWP